MRGMQIKEIIAAAALAMILAAFGGWGGVGGSGVAVGGVGGSGITVASVGTVTGFGSVIVNGVAYATGDAEIFTENESKGTGDAAAVQYLSAGMVVRVEGVLNADGSATASRVFFNGDLKGPVESITELDPYSSQLVILGQTVVLGPFCVFRNTTVAELAAGMVLRVSGYSDESGQIQATYVQRIGDALPPNGAVKLRGLVQSVDAQARTYTVNALTVDFSSADLSGLPGGIPQVAQLLEARGSLAAPERLTHACTADVGREGPCGGSPLASRSGSWACGPSASAGGAAARQAAMRIRRGKSLIIFVVRGLPPMK